MCFSIVTIRFPSVEVKPSNIRCGYDSLTVPRELFGISCRSTTLWSEKETVGPCGKCESVKAAGVPRCSCKRMISDRLLACAASTKPGNTLFPRFKFMEPGKTSLISLENDDSREEGSLEVVIRTRGSTIPERCEYSSSKFNSSSNVSSGRDSSYL